MLHAIYNNKIPSELRERFKVSEDSQTSSIFGTLLCLPTELIWKLLSDSCLDGDILIQCGKLREFDFWPRWKDNSRHVEPDLFLRFEYADIIVEAKRFDTKQQNYRQWKKEFLAYLNEYGEDNKTVFIVAMGGIRNIETEELVSDYENEKRTCKVFKLKWQKLLNQTKKIYDQLHAQQHIINNLDAILRILKTLILAFQIHGYLSQNLLGFDKVQKGKRYNNHAEINSDKLSLPKIKKPKSLRHKKDSDHDKITSLWQI